jgi:tetraacyldisaccharide 4'-kinase
LLPFSYIYDAGRRLRNLYTKPMTVPVPVICIGNLTAGGAGKTPVALHIGQWLKERRIHAFFLSRGYGGSLEGPVLVSAAHNARQVGDEPLLLAHILPTIVAKNRAAGAAMAVAQGAEVIVMDDGLQNPTLTKTLSLVVIDGISGFGNGRLLPAGPLREPAGAGLKRAHAIIVINPAPDAPLPEGAGVLHAKSRIRNAEDFRNKKLLAFCGIAHPENFFAALRSIPAELVETASFPDHHAYDDTELDALAKRAGDERLLLVTTAKDAVRLPEIRRAHIAVADMILTFDDEDRLTRLLESAVTHAKV